MPDRRLVVIACVFVAAFTAGMGFVAASRPAGHPIVAISGETPRLGVDVTPPPDADCTDRVVDTVSGDARTIALVGGEKYRVPSDRRDDVVGWDGADVRLCDAGVDRRSLTNVASEVTVPIASLDD